MSEELELQDWSVVEVRECQTSNQELQILAARLKQMCITEVS